MFDRHVEQIHRYAARRLGAQAADDMPAETFLTAFRRRASYDHTRPLARPWLYGIATNLIARHRRDEERFLRALSRTGAEPQPEPMADAVIGRVAAQGEDRRLAGALMVLSSADRDVLLLVALGELTYEEVAEARRAAGCCKPCTNRPPQRRFRAGAAPAAPGLASGAGRIGRAGHRRGRSGGTRRRTNRRDSGRKRTRSWRQGGQERRDRPRTRSRHRPASGCT
ncbi:hypothetical protein GCM10023334_086180 [Nonomuraea thailandensis]